MAGCGPRETALIIVFGSIHRVLKAERAFKEAGIGVELVTTPRDLSSDCGMVARIGATDLEKALVLLKAGSIGFLKIAREIGGRHEEITVSSTYVAPA